MNSFFLRTFSLLTVLLCLVASVGAAEVVLDNNTLLVKGVDDSIGLGAFNVVLTYTGNVTIQSVEGASGFMVASNILNGESQTFIAGISTEGKTGDIPVASIISTGSGVIEVSVRELANVRGDPISYTNEGFAGSVPTPNPGSSVINPEITVSQTPIIPSVKPVTTTAPPKEVPVTSSETPVATIDQPVTPTTSVPAGNNENPAVTETIPPTQSPCNFSVILISIASVFILGKKKRFLCENSGRISCTEKKV